MREFTVVWFLFFIAQLESPGKSWLHQEEAAESLLSDQQPFLSYGSLIYYIYRSDPDDPDLPKP